MRREASVNRMDTALNDAAEAAAVLAARTGVAHHDIALILGSGWGGAADLIGEEVASIEASEIPGYDAHAVAGHSSLMRSLRTPDGRAVLVLGARQHYYQVLDAAKVAHGVRMAAAAGCTTLVVTNGCGSSRPEVGPGSVVLISDHINYTGVTPLKGATFVDLTNAYSPRLRVSRDGHRSHPRGGRLHPVHRPPVRDAGRGADGHSVGR